MSAIPCLLVALVCVAPSSDSPQVAEDPRMLVEQTYTRVMEIALQAPDQSSLVDGLTSTLDGLIDYDAFSRKTLKGSWDRLSKRQQRRFVTLFKKLVIQTYAKRFKPQTSFSVSYRGETQWPGEDRAMALVLSTVHGERMAADVTYHLRRLGAGWRAVDLEVDEVSMALNWRRQFARIIKRDGFEALCAKLKKKVSP
jgi:phospholipid transport system substrate-binding protein